MARREEEILDQVARGKSSASSSKLGISRIQPAPMAGAVDRRSTQEKVDSALVRERPPRSLQVDDGDYYFQSQAVSGYRGGKPWRAADGSQWMNIGSKEDDPRMTCISM
eukprot:56949-Karenia_brevis.AAC.1